jgi:hypothetical protein
MTDLTDEWIEDAFVQIRAYFEGKGNEIGLDMLDSYEEQWDATGSLSDRQIAWLEKQLSWSRRGTSCLRRPTVAMAAQQQPDNEAQIWDALLEQRLAAKGKRLVDEAQFADLRKAIDDLNDVLGKLGV